MVRNISSKKYVVSWLKRCTFIFLWVCLLWLVGPLGSAKGHENSPEHHELYQLMLDMSQEAIPDAIYQKDDVLIIHSYHPQLAWNQGLTKGINSVFAESKHIELHAEYLDTKRYNLEETETLFAALIKKRHPHGRLKAVLVTDNNALEFVRRNRADLFPETPIIFCGVNQYDPSMLDDIAWYTGVVEYTDPVGSVDLAIEIRPNLRRMIVLGDHTPTGKLILQRTREGLGEEYNGIKIEYWDELPFIQILSQLEDLSEERDSVLLTLINKDNEGHYYDHEQSAHIVSRASNAPVFGLFDFYLGTGVIGGNMVNAQEQGKAAALIANEIIQGADVSEHPIVLESPNKRLLDDKTLTRFGVSLPSLPSKVTVMDQGRIVYQSDSVKTLKLGALANRGDLECKMRWSETADYLTRSLNGYQVEIVSLHYDEVFDAVERKEIDLLITNSSQFVELDYKYNLTAIASLQNIYEGKGYDGHASVILTLKSNAEINDLDDLKGCRFSAVHEQSFGGWRMAWREMVRQDIKPYKNFASLEFTSNHDQVVQNILFGKADAGCVRADVYAKLLFENTGLSGKLKVLNIIPSNSEYPFVRSTELYPDMPLIALPHTDDSIAREVAAAMIAMSGRVVKTQDNYDSWTIAQSYQPVHDALMELQVGSYKSLGYVSIIGMIKRHWAWYVGSLVIVFIASTVGIVFHGLNRRLRSSLDSLKESDENLWVTKQRVDELAEHSRTYTWETDKEDVFVFVSHVVADVLSYDPIKLVGTWKLCDLLSKKESYGLNQEVLSLYKKQLPVNGVVCELESKVGDKVWVKTHAVPYYDSAGQFSGYRGTNTDISKEYLAKIEAQESMAEVLALRDAINMHTMYCVLDRGGTFIEVNQGYADLSGYFQDELIGQHVRMLRSPKESRKQWKNLWRVVSDGNPWRGDLCFVNKNGDEYWVHTTVIPQFDSNYSVDKFICLGFDISIQVRDACKLDRMATRLSTATRGGGFAVWDYDLVNDKIVWDQTMYELYGIEDHDMEITVEFWQNTVHPEDRKKTETVFEESLRSGREFNLTYRSIDAQGIIKYIHALATIIRSSEGVPIHAIGINRDVTEQTLAYQKLEANESRLRRLLDSFFGFTATLSPDGIIIDVNKSALEVSGLQRNQVIGKRFEESYWWENGGHFREIIRQARRWAKFGRVTRFEAIFQKKNGELGTVDVKIGPIYDSSGRVEGVITFGVEVTDRAEAQQRLDLAMRSAKIGLWDFNFNTQEFFLSDTYFAMLGYKPGDLASSYTSWLECIHPDEVDDVVNTIQQHMDSKIPVFQHEHRICCKDGTWLWVRDEGEVIERNDDGTTKRIIGVQMDIQKSREMLERAESASRAKSEFLANMSHEIRTPMTAILGFSDILSSGGFDTIEPAQFDESIAAIRANAKHLLAIINDILDMSKIESGKMTVESIRLNPCSLLEEVASLTRPVALRKGLELNLEYLTAIPSSIQSDPTRLRQILLNFVGNSIKFTEAGSICVKTIYEDENRCLKFMVSDTGIGMSADQLKRISQFEAFVQSDTSMTRRFGGTGLGLRISKSFAQLLNGEISVESKEGVGSIFTLSLYIDESADISLIDPETFTGTTAELSTDNSFVQDDVTLPLNGAKILLAEDGVDNQRLLSFVLSKAGAEVQLADNGRIAIDIINQSSQESWSYDIILMDMQMPELDGYSATKQLRQRGCDLPIVALTAHAMSSDRDQCLAAGCDDFLSKPIDFGKLVSTCQRWLDERLKSKAS